MTLRNLFADTRPLKSLDFRRLWFAQIITVIGAQLTVVAVPAQLYADTGSSAYVGLTGIFGIVPLIVFGLWGGALADHFDRRNLLIITTLGIIATSAAFFAIAASGSTNVWFILLVYAAQQAFFAVNSPTRNAILPHIVDKELLPAANALNMTVLSIGGIAGPLIGGAMIPLLGIKWLYLADVLFLIPTLFAVIALPRHTGRVSSGEARDGEKRSVGLRSILEGLRYLHGRTVLIMSFVVDVIATFFGMPRALFPQIAHESFGGEIDGGFAFGLLFAAIPAGAALGGAFSGWISRVHRPGKVVTLAIALWGAGIFVFGVTSGIAGGEPNVWMWIGLVALMVAGGADMASAALRNSILLSEVEDSMRGRLQGVFFVVVVGGPRLADTLHGGFGALIGTAATTAIGGGLVILGMFAVTLLVPTFWRFNSDPHKL